MKIAEYIPSFILFTEIWSFIKLFESAKTVYPLGIGFWEFLIKRSKYMSFNIWMIQSCSRSSKYICKPIQNPRVRHSQCIKIFKNDKITATYIFQRFPSTWTESETVENNINRCINSNQIIWNESLLIKLLSQHTTDNKCNTRGSIETHTVGIISWLKISKYIQITNHLKSDGNEYLSCKREDHKKGRS